MPEKNLLIISNNFPNKDNSYVADIFVKEQIKYLKDYFDNVYVISPVAYGIERLRKTTHQDYQYDNVKIFFPKYFNVPFCYSKFRDTWVMFAGNAIINLIKKESIIFDLIHAHFTWPSGAIAVKLKQEFNVPVIITEHTHISLYKALINQDRHYLNTWNDCDAIIRVNKKDIPLFINAGIPANKLFYIPNGYDPKKYFPIPISKARHYLSIRHKNKIILNISRLYEEKGQQYLITSMARIVETHPDLVCYIGGSGPLKEKLQEQIKILSLGKNVKLIGFIADDTMSMCMNACDIFVLPSLSESFGIVQIEAMACGKPIIATRNGGSEEIITSDDYGLLVEPADPEDLAEKILEALDREWDREKILMYVERFTWEKIAMEIESVYDQVSQISKS